MKTIIKRAFALTVLSTLLFSCGGSDDTTPEADTNSGITMSLKVTGDPESEYVVNTSSVMEGTISAEGNGFESTDWNFVYNVGPSVFVVGYTDFKAQVYQENDNGEVEEVSSFQLAFPLEVFGNVDDETLLAIDAPRDGSHNGRKLYTVNAETGLVEDIATINIYEFDTGTPGEGVTAWPTALEVVGDKLFIPFYVVDDLGYYSTPDSSTAKVAVFDYPVETGDVPTIITTDLTGELGANGVTTGLVQTDSGDLYGFSCGAHLAGFTPTSTKSSGIVKINNGETEFDTDYFLDVEALTGGKVFWMDYAGGSKALARILTYDIDPAEDPEFAYFWGAYGRSIFNQELVVIDFDAETVTSVEGVPLHAKRYTSPLNEIDGSYYVSIETAEDAYVYEIDIDNATAVKGAEIEGKTIKGFYEL